jgi:hypothetical protein
VWWAVGGWREGLRERWQLGPRRVGAALARAGAGARALRPHGPRPRRRHAARRGRGRSSATCRAAARKRPRPTRSRKRRDRALPRFAPPPVAAPHALTHARRWALARGAAPPSPPATCCPRWDPCRTAPTRAPRRRSSRHVRHAFYAFVLRFPSRFRSRLRLAPRGFRPHAAPRREAGCMAAPRGA